MLGVKRTSFSGDRMSPCSQKETSGLSNAYGDEAIPAITQRKERIRVGVSSNSTQCSSFSQMAMVFFAKSGS